MRVPAPLLSLVLLSPAIAHGQVFVHPGILLDLPALEQHATHCVPAIL